MNFYKKFNTYLLENHPLIWHSKVIQLLAAGILFWVISFLAGYGMMNLKTLQDFHIRRYFERSGFVYFHVVYAIIVTSVWALYFYKNNAFKNYYPLKKGYFLSLFLQLFVSFFILTSAYYPFYTGTELKAKSLFDEKNLKEDIDKLNLGHAFIINSPDYYVLENRSYPKPYPLQIVRYDENSNSWESPNNNTIHPDSTFKHSFDNSDWTSANFNENYTVTVEGRKMQFFKAYPKIINKGECDSYDINVVSKMYSLKELDNPQLSSLLNYSTVLVSTPYERMGERTFPELPKNKYEPIIHKMVREKNYIEIKNTINNFIRVCNKYKIANHINAAYLTKYLYYKNCSNLNSSITSNWQDLSHSYNYMNELDELKTSIPNKELFIKNMNNQHVYYFKSSDLDQLFYNHSYMYTEHEHSYSLLFYLFLAFGLSCLFIWFEFNSIKSLLITIPVAGVLVIINIMIIVFSYASEKMAFTTFLTTFAVIIVLTLLGVYKKMIPKKIVNILLNLTYIIAPIFLIVAVLFYDELTNDVYVQSKCYGMEHITKHSVLIEPYLFFAYSFVGLLLFIPILKKWKALEE